MTTLKCSDTDISKKILNFAEFPDLRYRVCKYIDHENIISMNDESRKIAEWWKKQKNDIRRKTIMILHDDPDVLDMLVSLLKVNGFDQVYSETSEIKTIETAERIKPSLIVTIYSTIDELYKMVHSFEFDKMVNSFESGFIPLDTKIVIAVIQGIGNIAGNDVFVLNSYIQPFMLDRIVELVYRCLTGRMENETNNL